MMNEDKKYAWSDMTARKRTKYVKNLKQFISDKFNVEVSQMDVSEALDDIEKRLPKDTVGIQVYDVNDDNDCFVVIVPVRISDSDAYGILVHNNGLMYYGH